MELSYETEELRDYERFPAQALAAFGPSVARALATLFADLRSLSNAAELAAFGAKEFEFGELRGIKLPIAGQVSMALVPSHPKQKDLVLEWSGVRRLKLLAIGRLDDQS